MTKHRTPRRFILCIDDTGCEDLEKGKVYRVLPDSKAKRAGFVRVVDESAGDYLYPESHFVAIDIPPAACEALTAAS